MPFGLVILCRICEDQAANVLILHTCAGDVQGVNKIFIYIIQVVSREFESLRAHHNCKVPFISLKSGQAVHGKSATARFDGGEDGCSDADSVVPALWTEKELRPGSEMYEQVRVQSGGYRITLLSIDESECDDDDEEYARDGADWRPRFAVRVKG
jgi:hypothetical protein